jgi:hypothetical protein
MTDVIDSLGQNIVKEPESFYDECPHDNGDEQNTPKHWTACFKKTSYGNKNITENSCKNYDYNTEDYCSFMTFKSPANCDQKVAQNTHQYL